MIISYRNMFHCVDRKTVPGIYGCKMKDFPDIPPTNVLMQIDVFNLHRSLFPVGGGMQTWPIWWWLTTVHWMLCEFYVFIHTERRNCNCIVLNWWLNNFLKQNNVEIVSRMFVFVCNCCFNILFASSVNRNFFAHNSPMGPTLQPTSIAAVSMELHFFFILLSFSVFRFFVFSFSFIHCFRCFV